MGAEAEWWALRNGWLFTEQKEKNSVFSIDVVNSGGEDNCRAHCRCWCRTDLAVGGERDDNMSSFER